MAIIEWVLVDKDEIAFVVHCGMDGRKVQESCKTEAKHQCHSGFST